MPTFLWALFFRSFGLELDFNFDPRALVYQNHIDSIKSRSVSDNFKKKKLLHWYGTIRNFRIVTLYINCNHLSVSFVPGPL